MGKSGKQIALELIERLPENATLEDIMYELYIRDRVEHGVRDDDEGRTVRHEDVRRSVQRWLKSAGR